ncbi:metal-dependent hydrolase [Methylophaga thiooxydans]|uniref:Metal-dependent hydrolase n=1 Tax=Methylophaga thiooxydans TaxID=392484 RepID=A0A0A0BEK5_9GAMM|nr:M48 family metallopeptidase [Methylophaga thiooxydans]KGM06265.1 metal-dependent hydrolase [Methylophaga thiooxydans]
MQLKYLTGYPESVLNQIRVAISQETLGQFLQKKYPDTHDIKTNKALYSYVMDLKSQYLRQSNTLSKVVYDDKLDVLHQALGLHTYVSRVQGNKLKAKNEMRIGSVFKTAPPEFLNMIVVHELSHLKEKDHNKAFYKLCTHMEPNYHQLEFDVRLYLTYLDIFGELY